MKPILLFDIDGTLLHVKRAFLYEIISNLLDELSIKKDPLENSSFAGRTDKDIFSELISRSTLPKPDFIKIKSLYIDQIEQNLTSDQIDIIPGAFDSILYANEKGYDVGLCTGNFKEVAFKKIEAAGLSGMFKFGGYGCNHVHRKFLPAEAHQSYSTLKKVIPNPEQYVVIGDTPNDISCAQFFGARSVAVTTGNFTKKELSVSNPDFIFEELGNPKKWISEL